MRLSALVAAIALAAQPNFENCGMGCHGNPHVRNAPDDFSPVKVVPIDAGVDTTEGGAEVQL